MTLTKVALAAAVTAGSIFGAAIGLGAATATADPVPPPYPYVEAPAWAPRKPAESWHGYPMQWWDGGGYGGRWGVWINDNFLPFS